MFDICRKAEHGGYSPCSAFVFKRILFKNSLHLRKQRFKHKEPVKNFSEKPDKRAVDGRHDYRSDAYAAESAEKASVSTHAAARQQKSKHVLNFGSAMLNLRLSILTKNHTPADKGRLCRTKRSKTNRAARRPQTEAGAQAEQNFPGLSLRD